MHTIDITTDIHAPPARCFDLTRSVEAHLASAEDTGERVVAGKTTGLLGLGDRVTWEARHLGVRQRLTSEITAYDRPHFFQDRMVRGAFRFLEHDHSFNSVGDDETTMRDIVRFVVPGGWPGRGLGRWVIVPHLTRFLDARAQALKAMAESDGWRDHLAQPGS